MDVQQLLKLSEEVFRLRQQFEAYARLQAEEIDELRSKLKDVERQLSRLHPYAPLEGTHVESGEDDDNLVGSL